MGRYTIRAYGRRLIARISTERNDNAISATVSHFGENEKRHAAA
jgi:hypothetical protein